MSDTELLPKSKEEPVRRSEVFTGAGRRHAWSAEQKDRIVAESYESSETVSAVARRHALTRQQLFGWRRAARQRRHDERDARYHPCSRWRGRVCKRSRHAIPLQCTPISQTSPFSAKSTAEDMDAVLTERDWVGHDLSERYGEECGVARCRRRCTTGRLRRCQHTPPRCVGRIGTLLECGPVRVPRRASIYHEVMGCRTT